MKGVIFNILEELVEQRCGMQAWNNILSELGNAGIYTAGKSYPDEDLMVLVGAVSAKLEMPDSEVIGMFGEYMFSQLADRYPIFIEQENTLRGFLKSVDEVIHVEVRKLYENPNLPSFNCIDTDDQTLLMEYRSPRQLCILAEGLIRGAAQHYKTTITLEHPRCMHKGHDHCDLIIRFQA
ncbi:MAG: heme NO-binding domain-containing protein [Amphritea sp.]|nr:heme NO-binding domain-containing protein [Amphritea sp.]MBQ0782762.1 heme NO-binding domain-containing protein [Amphritea sp.]